MENLEPKIRYLEMIQTVITRMANNSFALKGWTVTLITGIFALSARDANMSFFLIAYIPVFLFWIIDSYYLQLERKYRALYKIVAKMDSSEIDFNLEAPKANWGEKTYYFQSIISKTEIGFYLPSGILVAIVVHIAQKLVG